MNVNEVVASLAARAGVDAHPNDVVNASQSSNDTFPSAIHVAAVLAARPLDQAVGALADALTAKAERVRRRREVGPHPPDGRHPGHAGPGARRVRRHRGVRPGATGRRAPPRPRAAAGGHRRRHRHQHPAGLRRADHRPPQRRHRRGVHRGAQPLRGAGHPGLPGRAERRPQDLRRRAGQDLQRPALDGQRPHRRPRRDPPAGPPARVEHHARQGQPGHPRGDAPGLRAGDRQRRRDHVRRQPRAASSST